MQSKDNPFSEAQFKTLKTGLVYRTVLANKADARRRLIAWCPPVFTVVGVDGLGAFTTFSSLARDAGCPGSC